MEMDDFDKQLIDKLRQFSDNRKPYQKVIAKIPWDKVSFDGHSADECRERWRHLESRVRTHRVLSELLDDAAAGRWDPLRSASSLKSQLLKEGFPTRPLNAFMRFRSAVADKLRAQYPHKTFDEISQLVVMQYASLPRAELDQYRRQYEHDCQQYKHKCRLFFEQHPEFSKPEQAAPTALQIFKLKQAAQLEDQSGSAVTAAFNALSPQQRAVYERKAEKAAKKYWRQVELYQKNVDPLFKPKTQHQQQDEAHVPPAAKKPKCRTLYQLFSAEVWPTLPASAAGLGAKAKLVSAMYKSADPQLLKRLAAKAEEERAAYELFLQSLPEEQRKLHNRRNNTHSQQNSRRRTPVRRTAKQAFVDDKLSSCDLLVLSEPEWRKILSRKYTELSSQEKAKYTTMAAEQTAAAKSLPYVNNSSSSERHYSLAVADTTTHEQPSESLLPTTTNQQESSADVPVAVTSTDADASVKQKRRVKRPLINTVSSGGDAAGVVASSSSSSICAPDTHTDSGKRLCSDVNISTEVPQSQLDLTEGSDSMLLNQSTSDADYDGAFELFCQKHSRQLDDDLSEKKKLKLARRAWRDLSESKRARLVARFCRKRATIAT